MRAPAPLNRDPRVPRTREFVGGPVRFFPRLPGPDGGLGGHPLSRAIRLADLFPPMVYSRAVEPFLAHEDAERTRRLNKASNNAPRPIPARAAVQVYLVRRTHEDRVFMAFSGCGTSITISIWNYFGLESATWVIAGEHAGGVLRIPHDLGSWRQSVARDTRKDFSASVASVFLPPPLRQPRSALPTPPHHTNVVEALDANGFPQRLLASDAMIDTVESLMDDYFSPHLERSRVLSRDGTLLAICTDPDARRITVWNLAHDVLVGAYETPQAGGAITRIEVEAPATRKLVVQTSSTAIYAWDLDRPACRTTMRPPSQLQTPPRARQALALSPNGAYLAASQPERGAIAIWTLAPSPGAGVALGGPQTPRVVAKATVDPCFTAMRFSPDGTRLAAAAANGFLRVWDVSSGESVYACDRHRDELHTLAWSPGSRYLATCCIGGTARVARIP